MQSELLETSWPLVIFYGNGSVIIDRPTWLPFIHLSSYWWWAPAGLIFFLSSLQFHIILPVRLKSINTGSFRIAGLGVNRRQILQICGTTLQTAAPCGWRLLGRIILVCCSSSSQLQRRFAFIWHTAEGSHLEVQMRNSDFEFVFEFHP